MLLRSWLRSASRPVRPQLGYKLIWVDGGSAIVGLGSAQAVSGSVRFSLITAFDLFWFGSRLSLLCLGSNSGCWGSALHGLGMWFGSASVRRVLCWVLARLNAVMARPWLLRMLLYSVWALLQCARAWFQCHGALVWLWLGAMVLSSGSGSATFRHVSILVRLSVALAVVRLNAWHVWLEIGSTQR